MIVYKFNLSDQSKPHFKGCKTKFTYLLFIVCRNCRYKELLNVEQPFHDDVNECNLTTTMKKERDNLFTCSSINLRNMYQSRNQRINSGE